MWAIENLFRLIVSSLMRLAFSEVVSICKLLQGKFFSSRCVVTWFNKFIKLLIIFCFLPNSFLKKRISSCRNLSKWELVQMGILNFRLGLRSCGVPWWCKKGKFFWLFSSWICSFSISLFTFLIIWEEENGSIYCNDIPLFEFLLFSLLLLSIKFFLTNYGADFPLPLLEIKPPISKPTTKSWNEFDSRSKAPLFIRL